jgi:hypothetical protein
MIWDTLIDDKQSVGKLIDKPVHALIQPSPRICRTLKNHPFPILNSHKIQQLADLSFAGCLLLILFIGQQHNGHILESIML